MWKIAFKLFITRMRDYDKSFISETFVEEVGGNLGEIPFCVSLLIMIYFAPDFKL